MKNEGLKIGEKVDLHMGKGPYYRTVVDDLSPHNFIEVPIPTFRGISIILRADQELKLFYYRDNGRFAIKVQVISLDLDDQVKTVKLRVLSKPERQQRRESFRVNTLLKAVLRPTYLGPFPRKPDPAEEKEMEEVRTFNLSATGIAVSAHGEYAVGERLYLNIFLSWPKPDSPPLDILGEIRQVTRLEPNSSIFQLGIMFLNASDEMTTHLARFVMMEDQRRMKQTRLIEDD